MGLVGDGVWLLSGMRSGGSAGGPPSPHSPQGCALSLQRSSRPALPEPCLSTLRSPLLSPRVLPQCPIHPSLPSTATPPLHQLLSRKAPTQTSIRADTSREIRASLAVTTLTAAQAITSPQRPGEDQSSRRGFEDPARLPNCECARGLCVLSGIKTPPWKGERDKQRLETRSCGI